MAKGVDILMNLLFSPLMTGNCTAEHSVSIREAIKTEPRAELQEHFYLLSKLHLRNIFILSKDPESFAKCLL